MLPCVVRNTFVATVVNSFFARFFYSTIYAIILAIVDPPRTATCGLNLAPLTAGTQSAFRVVAAPATAQKGRRALNKHDVAIRPKRWSSFTAGVGLAGFSQNRAAARALPRKRESSREVFGEVVRAPSELG